MTTTRTSSKSANVLYRTIDAALRRVLRRVPVSPRSEQVALWWGYRFNPDPGIVTLRSGAKIRTTHVDHLQLLLSYLGTFEPLALDAMRRHLEVGGTMLDVGANIGLFTIEAAQAVGPSGRVVSIEAAPHHALSVRNSVALNNMTNVEVVSVAVGDVDGEATLILPHGANYGMFTLGKVDGNESFSVAVRKIDDIIGERKIHFVKMDIEGSEYRALLGARKTLERDRPSILIELNEAALQACGSSSRQVKEFLSGLGYKGKLLAGTPITLDQAHICDECLFTHAARG
jgi:FkbM family methyltransferase